MGVTSYGSLAPAIRLGDPRRQHRHRGHRRRRPAHRLRARLPDLAAVHGRVFPAAWRALPPRGDRVRQPHASSSWSPIAIATFVACGAPAAATCARWRSIVALTVPAQAVIGGITVLTDLNPWVVSLPPARLAGHHRRRRTAAAQRRCAVPRARARPRGRAGLGDVRRGLGGPLRRHRRHRLRPARRRRRRPAERPGPASAEPVPRGPGLPLRGAHPRPAVHADGHRRRPRRPARGHRAALRRGGPGHDRLRAVLHRPPRRPGRLPRARRRSDLGLRHVGAAASTAPGAQPSPSLRAWPPSS